jgi:hypothetical protein
MKTIQKDELYEHVGRFLQSKGIELKDGSYTKGIHAGCSLLADAINLSQAGIERAKAGLDRKLDQVRQVIHKKTAPKRRPAPPVIVSTRAGSPNGKKRPGAAKKGAKAKMRSPKKQAGK